MGRFQSPTRLFPCSFNILRRVEEGKGWTRCSLPWKAAIWESVLICVRMIPSCSPAGQCRRIPYSMSLFFSIYSLALKKVSELTFYKHYSNLCFTFWKRNFKKMTSSLHFLVFVARILINFLPSSFCERKQGPLSLLIRHQVTVINEQNCKKKYTF